MTGSNLVETLASYVPELVTRRLATSPGPITAPTGERFPAAVLFADIAGSTPLAEQLAQRGPAGAETLVRELNLYFGQLVQIIAAHGGDVVKFAGDALTAIWSAAESTGLQAATQQAAACALAIQKALRDYTTTDGFELALRIGLGAGDILVAHIGGMFDRWELVIAGAPLNQVARAGDLAPPGEVILSPEAWQWVGPGCTGQVLSDGCIHLDEMADVGTTVSPTRRPLPPNAEAALRAYVPRAILSRLEAGQHGWLAELRNVTVLFVNLPDLSYDTTLEQAQAAMRALQAALYHYEGSVNKISVDDKGATLVAVLGLPPLAHRDDALRGVQAAVEMQAALQALNWHCAIGVTTGCAFCGTIGSETRREYTAMGDVVNLSARLMQAAKASGSPILCDEPTYRAAQDHFDFITFPPVQVKGKSHLVPVYGPSGERTPSQLQIARLQLRSAMVGRVAEKAILADKLQDLTQGKGSAIVIEGEAGIGKSRLMADLMEQAQAAGVHSLVGAGDAVEKTTAYHAWRPVYRQLFPVGEMWRAAAQQYVLDRLTAMDPVLAERAPLLSTVLLLDLPDTELTAQMTGEVRADNTRNLLVRALTGATGTAPTLLVIEDAHWLDSASWALLQQVKREVRPLLLVVVTRPMERAAASLPVEYKRLLDDADTTHIRLTALPPEDALTLVCRRLGVTRLPVPVADFIARQAEGHPYFSQEIAYALRDAGLIHVVDGACRIAPEAGDLRDLDFPRTIQGVITSRIDRLTPQQQLALKVASVIGRVFALRALRDVHPIAVDVPHLADYIAALARLDITPLETPEPDLAYMFKHAITQEVTYSLLLYAQRRQLHRAVAEWLERIYADDLTPYYPLLAHHWGESVDVQYADPLPLSKTMDYLEKAGEQALRGGAYREAVGYLSRAIDLAEKWKDKGVAGQDKEKPLSLLTPRRLAHWQRLLGEAHWGLGHLVESCQHLEQALSLLGQPMPTTTGLLVISLMGRVLRMVWHWVRPPGSSKQSPEAKANLLETARPYVRLALIYYVANEPVLQLYAGLSGFNLAVRAGPSPELLRFYAIMYGFCRFFHLHRLARVYKYRAQEIAETVNDLPALAWTLMCIGLYSFGIDPWTSVQSDFEQAVALSERLGDRRNWGDSLTTLGFTLYFQAQFAAGVDVYMDLYALASGSGNLEHRAWALNGQAMNLLRLGQTDQAVTLLETGWPLLAKVAQSHAAEIINRGLMTVARLCQGQMEAARQAAEMVAQLTGHSIPTSFAMIDGYTGPAQVYLALWEEAVSGGTQARKALRSAARRACTALRRFAWLHPVGQPRAWLYRGWFAWLSGHHRRARRHWRRSLVHAKRLAMPYEEGLAHYEIGRHLPSGDPERQAHLRQAVEIFARSGAAYDLEQAKAEL